MIKVFLLTFLPLNIFAFDITNCKITKNTQTLINIELNSKILIKDVVYRNNELIMPYEEYKGKQYFDIKILSKDFYLKLIKIAKENKCEITQSKKNFSYEISDIKKLNSKARIANVYIYIDKAINLTCGLMKSKNGDLWISFPKNFIFLDLEEKKLLEEKILAYYNKNK